MGIKHLHIFAFETTLKSAYRLTNQLVKLAKILYIKFPQREVPRLAVAGRTYHSLIQTHHIWDQQACTTGRTEGLCFKYFYGWIQRWVWHWLWLVYRHKWTVNDIFLSISRADILALYSGTSHSLSSCLGRLLEWDLDPTWLTIIWTESLSAVEALKAPNTHHPLVNDLLAQSWTMMPLNISWIRDHSKSTGNEYEAGFNSSCIKTG